jgi:hypothetical protein
MESGLIFVGLGAFTGGLTIVLEERRWMLLALLGVYGSVAGILALDLPLPIGGVKMLSGTMVCLILLLSQIRTRWGSRASALYTIPSGWTFRLSATMLVLTAAWGIWRSGLSIFPGVDPNAQLCSVMLLGVGLLNAGISDDAYRVGFGLLTLIAGFEAGYSGLEPSLALAALLAGVHIGIALVVSYLMVSVEPAAERRRSGA